MTNTKTEIVTDLELQFTTFSKTIQSLTKERFEQAPTGKWSAGQQLDHLIRSVKPLNMALGLPNFVPRLLFGKLNRPSRNYEEVLQKYNDKLATGSKATGPYVPPTIAWEAKEKAIKAYQVQLSTLIKYVNAFTDAELDSILLPHPLLGKLTIREMLFFTIFHTAHHQSSISALVEGK